MSREIHISLIDRLLNIDKLIYQFNDDEVRDFEVVSCFFKDIMKTIEIDFWKARYASITSEVGKFSSYLKEILSINYIRPTSDFFHDAVPRSFINLYVGVFLNNRFSFFKLDTGWEPKLYLISHFKTHKEFVGFSEKEQNLLSTRFSEIVLIYYRRGNMTTVGTYKLNSMKRRDSYSYLFITMTLITIITSILTFYYGFRYVNQLRRQRIQTC